MNIDFRIGEDVYYVPSHERGVVTSVNDNYVFVRYGDDKQSQATYRDDLIRVPVNELIDASMLGVEEIINDVAALTLQMQVTGDLVDVAKLKLVLAMATDWVRSQK